MGLAAPGLAAPDGRCITWMPGRMHGLEGLDWTTRLGRPVKVLNDAQAALLAEVAFGAARGCRDVFLLTLGTGTGVGGAVWSGGRLLTGATGRAGIWATSASIGRRHAMSFTRRAAWNPCWAIRACPSARTVVSPVRWTC